MFRDYYEEFENDLPEFVDKTKKFYEGELTVAEYKGFSGGFGSYAQRGAQKSMLRLRLPGGEIDRPRLKFIAESMEKYNVDKAHFTTCETVQLHNLDCDSVCALVKEAWQAGIITRGGGGDFPRNVMCSPLSGLDCDEKFNVMPYAKAAGDYLLGFINKVKLPRKLKVCFSNGANNEVHATFRDLGFIAKENGKFDVYCAGGMGNRPKFGVKVVEDLEPCYVLFAIKTMVDIFTEYGNYEQRNASRTRFLQDTLGVEKLQEIFKQKLADNIADESMQDKILDIEELNKIGLENITKEKLASAELIVDADLLMSDRIYAQKQHCLYAVHYKPVGGNIPVDFFRRIYDATQDMQCNDVIKLRITPNQGVYIINLTADEARKILEITSDTAKSAFECSTACIGADICQVGIGKSQIMLNECVKAVREAGIAPHALPSIHISGCPSSCTAHQTARIGLRGGMKQTADGPKPAFMIYLNGSEEAGKEAMGEELGVMTTEDIPKFFVELGKTISDSCMDYEKYFASNCDNIRQIAQKYI